MNSHYHYNCYGFQIDSEIELPELRTGNGTEADVRIRLAKVPDKLEDALKTGIGYQIKKDNYILTIANVAKYQALRGNEIRIDPYPGADEQSIRVFLLASVFGALSHQRGVLPMHASAIDYQGEAVLFAGSAGSGKSTTAVAFGQKGFPVMSDDISVIRFQKDQPVLYPGPVRSKLWLDSLRQLNYPYREEDRVRPSLEKFLVTTGGKDQTNPLPVKKMFILRQKDVASVAVETLTGRLAFNAVRHNTFRSRLMEGLGAKPRHFQLCSAFAASIPVIEVSRPNSPFTLDEVVDRIHKMIAS